MSKPRIVIGIDPAAGPDRAGCVLVPDRDVAISRRGADYRKPLSTAELANLQGFDATALNARIAARYAEAASNLRERIERGAAIHFRSQDCNRVERTAKTVEPVSVSFSTPSTINSETTE